MLSYFTCSIINHCNTSNNNYTVDYSLLDDNMLSALNGDLDYTVNIDDNVNNQQIINEINCDTEEVDVEVDNGIGAKSTKVKKVPIHEATYHNLLSKGTEKIKAMNLPVERYHKNFRL